MKLKTMIGTGAAIALLSLNASAVELSFFGEDLGLGEYSQLTSWPNATAAESDFLSNLVGVGTEDFEGFAPNVYTPLSVNFPGAGTATLTGDGYTQAGPNSNGRYPISGRMWYQASEVFSIEFSDPVAAFGFYGVDIGDFGGQVTLTFEDGTTVNKTVPNTVDGLGGGVLYYGYINTDEAFTKVTFGNTASGVDYFAFDDMTIGSMEQVHTTPDAGSSLLLLGSGLMALQALRRRLA